ncbi:hypothetical protein [Gemmatimonas groenlandica]|uniref:Uncharacterized protein n=1 Tax=Gemmatimonas groenlandica TaxID=2732249 RepID=A0A6M4IMD2_9BACT|nr:hypothetical protein [Gemmatimonas groenlandica]QJR34576.1 hypothetical protein HKW67_03105 [Gemmatimonas groenlandica]
MTRVRSVRTIARLSRMGARLTLLSSALLAFVLLSAHVGTNQVVFEGQAGGYPVRVLINPPGVVPAQVPIAVRVLSGTPSRVTVRAAQWNVGTKGAPPAEDAAIVPGDPGVWAHDLWIMTASIYAVYVAVEGPAGNGTVVVPMQTSATRTLGMERGMAAVLIALGTLLVAGMLTIIGAAVREGPVAPGQLPPPARVRGARIAIGAGAALLALALFGGSKWWDVEERAYERRMLKPIAMQASVRLVDAERVLTMAITDSLWLTNRFAPVMPDHGKLMHLFLIRADGAEGTSVLAHLHPLRVHADTFVTRIPPMTAGRYLLFGDLLLQNGAQRTLVDTIDLPVAPVVPGEDGAVATVVSSAVVPSLDTDDAWSAVTPVPLGVAYRLASGGTMVLTADARVDAERDLRLVATVTNADGSLSTLAPYMGMGGHAMVLRRDAGVFMHLHPMGTASMTAQAQLMRRERGDTALLDSAQLSAAIATAEMATAEMATAEMASGGSHAAHAAGPSALAFPFAFPTAGAYRVFVQVRRNDAIETAAFDVSVGEPVRPFTR